MMKPFLRQVADHYFQKGDISRRCFVFPNRRSMVFFRQWLSKAVAENAGMPLLAPRMLTVNDLFHQVAGLTAADKVSLLIELYDCYKQLYPKAESLDEFIFWGDVILGDFNDVDKYLADPKQLFANVADFKAIQDTFSYLSDVQRQAIESFVSHFNDRNGRLTVNLDAENPNVKERFLQIWNILYPMYVNFNNTLRTKGMAYEGMVYRTLAETVTDVSVEDMIGAKFPSDTSFVFVGLNALNECEKVFMRRLRDCGRAEFCWDWSGDMIRDPKNRSSFFMSVNYSEFPPAFELDGDGVGKAVFNALSVSSSYGQVKHVGTVLERVGYTGVSGSESSDTAVVIPDESLLMPLLNSIPEEVSDINVTMGYPMSASELYVFMSDVAAMQLRIRKKESGWHYYHKHVWDILSSGLMKFVMSSEEMAGCRENVARIKKEGKYYIPQEDLSGYPVLDVIFRPVAHDPSAKDAAQIQSLAEYLQSVVSFLAPVLMADPDMAVELEFARKYYESINSLRSRNLEIQPATFIKLLSSLMAGVTIPFKGEPLKGLQIMGPLETRALDFRNVVILSCNEGMFPRRSVSSSFVPPELRKAFGLPTYEYQDAIWAYYFYRLVSRAENVWMLYDSRTEGLKRGEESRYIKQLKYHFGVDVNTYVAAAELSSSDDVEDSMEKTDEMMKTIGDMSFSVSALQNYVICPMKFCYKSVLKLAKDEDVAESLDNAMIGNVYHNAMWALFRGEDEMRSDKPFEKLENQADVAPARVTSDYLESWLDREDDVREKVISLMKGELNTDEITGRDLVVQRVIVRYVMETIRKDILLLEKYGAEAFEIIGLEKKVYANLYGSRFFGVIDRIDSLAPGMVRMVDYKSGSDSPSVIAISGNIENAVEKIFDAKYSVREDNKAALQFHIYDRMAQAAGIATSGDQLCNTMYSASELFRKVPQVYLMNDEFAELMDVRLQGIMDEIHDQSVPFRRTDDADACKYCDFKMICGR